MKIDLKHTTKDKLYEMLCEAEEIMKKQAEHSEAQAKQMDALEGSLLETTKNAARLTTDLFNANKEIAKLKLELDKAKALEEETKAMIKRADAERYDYFKSWQWCVLHPWKNLWKNMVKQ